MIERTHIKIFNKHIQIIIDSILGLPVCVQSLLPGLGRRLPLAPRLQGGCWRAPQASAARAHGPLRAHRDRGQSARAADPPEEDRGQAEAEGAAGGEQSPLLRSGQADAAVALQIASSQTEEKDLISIILLRVNTINFHSVENLNNVKCKFYVYYFIWLLQRANLQCFWNIPIQFQPIMYNYVFLHSQFVNRELITSVYVWYHILYLLYKNVSVYTRYTMLKGNIDHCRYLDI